MATTKCKKCGGTINKFAKGGTNTKMGIYGIPQENVGTSSQYMPTAKKGGAVKKVLKIAKFGASVSVQRSPRTGKVTGVDGGYAKIGNREPSRTKFPKFAKGGSSFGMLSVKAGVDNNPKPTAADRIAGAKMSKKKIGGIVRKKK